MPQPISVELGQHSDGQTEVESGISSSSGERDQIHALSILSLSVLKLMDVNQS